MSQIVKAFTGIFMVMFLMMTATGILGAFLEVSNAQDLHAAIIDELENSNYARAVLEECFAVAEEASYQLEICLYSNNGLISCTSAADIPISTTTVSMAEVVLKYPFKIAFFDLNMQQKIFGYAR